MRILVTNDDGIHAEGLDVCEKIARELSDDVWVIAPEYDQSGVAHSLSLNDPLRLRQVAERRFAVRGTPTDCVIMGARHVLNGKRPDLVLSGVNRGRNAGEDVIYSGTVAGAVEGTVIGIPSLALSQAINGRSGRPPFWETSLRYGPDIIRRVIAEGIPRDVLINVNFPDCRPDEVRRIAVTPQGRQGADRLHIDERKDGRGNPYYWIAYARLHAAKGEDAGGAGDACAGAEPVGAICRRAPEGWQWAGLHPDRRRRHQEFHGSQGRGRRRAWQKFRTLADLGQTAAAALAWRDWRRRFHGTSGAGVLRRRFDQRRDLCRHDRAGRWIA